MGRGARHAPAHLAILLSSLMLAPPAPRQEWRRFPHLPHWQVSLPYEHVLPSSVSSHRLLHKTVDARYTPNRCIALRGSTMTVNPLGGLQR